MGGSAAPARRCPSMADGDLAHERTAEATDLPQPEGVPRADAPLGVPGQPPTREAEPLTRAVSENQIGRAFSQKETGSFFATGQSRPVPSPALRGALLAENRHCRMPVGAFSEPERGWPRLLGATCEIAALQFRLACSIQPYARTFRD